MGYCWNELEVNTYYTYLYTWEQRENIEVFDRVKSYALPRSEETEKYTGFKYIHYGDIHTGIASIIDENSCLPNIKQGQYELLQEGDLVLADASEDYQGIAQPALVAINPEYNLVSGLHTIALRPLEFDPLFLYYLFFTPSFKRYGYQTGTGMKVFGISVSNVMKYKGLYPSIGEQVQIGLLLKKMENTIALHLEYIHKLEVLRKNLLEQIMLMQWGFKKNDKHAEIKTIWKVCELGEILQINSGRDYKHLSEGKVPVYGTGGYMLSVDGSLSDVDAIGIGRKGTIDKPQYLKAPFWTVDTLFFMTPKKDTDLLFCLALANQIHWKKYDESTGVPSLSKINIEKINVSIPTYEEQRKIGQLYSQFDSLIYFQRAKITKLQRLKQALLQKMFI